MKFNQRAGFLKQLKQSAPNHLSRVYLIAVPDDFEREEVVAAILRYLATPDRSVERFYGSDFKVKAFYEHLQTRSLFGGEPIAVLDELEKLGKNEQLDLLRERLTYGYLILATRGKSPLAAAAEKEGVVLDVLEEKPWEKEKRLSEELNGKAASKGKSFAPGVLSLFVDRLEKDAALLTTELDKLICYIGDRHRIEAFDVETISSSSKTHTVWQRAEELVWEGHLIPSADDSFFHALIPAVRSQLQLGLKICSLLELNATREEWSEALPKVFPKTLDKRTSQAEKLGKKYFINGLSTLFEIELASRSGSDHFSALLDLFRIKSYASR